MGVIGYRQRLTNVGLFGAVVGMVSPLVIGAVIADYTDRIADTAGNPYITWAPAFPAAEVIALSLATSVGWVLVLIGREHYPVEFDEAEPAYRSLAKKKSGKITPAAPPAER